MQNIDRIRPRSKRKAINAAAFHERYQNDAAEAEARGDLPLAAKLRRKSTYWQAKCARWMRSYQRSISG